MDVCSQILRCRQHSLKPLSAGVRGRFTRSIPWGDLFIPGALVHGPDRLFDLRIADDQESPSLHVSTARRADTGFKDLTDQFVRHPIWLQPPHRPSRSYDLE